jgi:hypothetical protein
MNANNSMPTDRQDWRRGLELAIELIDESACNSAEHALDPIVGSEIAPMAEAPG